MSFIFSILSPTPELYTLSLHDALPISGQFFTVLHHRRRDQLGLRRQRGAAHFDAGFDPIVRIGDLAHRQNIDAGVVERAAEVDDAALDRELLAIGRIGALDHADTAGRARQPLV